MKWITSDSHDYPVRVRRSRGGCWSRRSALVFVTLTALAGWAAIVAGVALWVTP